MATKFTGAVDSTILSSTLPNTLLDNAIIVENSILEQLFDIDPSCDLPFSLYSILEEQTKNFYNFSSNMIMKNDFTGLGSEAHKLKSSFGSLGLVELQRICKQIELLSKDIEAREYKERLQELLELFRDRYTPSMEMLKRSLNGFKNEKKAS